VVIILVDYEDLAVNLCFGVLLIHGCCLELLGLVGRVCDLCIQMCI
jgi:hypothetical protein